MSTSRAARLPIVFTLACALAVCLTWSGAAQAPATTGATRVRAQDPARIQVPTVAMPNLVGQSYQAALRDPAVVRYKLALTARESPSTRTPGTIVGQEPAAGSPIRLGSPATVLVAAPPAQGRAPRPPDRESLRPDVTTIPLIRVPKVSGLSEGQATEELSSRRFQVVRQTAVVADQKAGTVITQTPEAGTLVRPRSAVSITVARPHDPVLPTMPDLVGRSFSLAVQHPQVLEARLRLDQQFDTTAPGLPGTVVRQSVPAGSGVEVGRTVTVLVATGVAVPLVLKQSSGVAERQIAAAGLRPAVSTATSDQEPGTVVSQVPAAGVMVSRGASVAITVATAETVTVPDVIGRTRAEADQELTRLKLRVVAEDDALSTNEPGRVATQQPPSGADVSAGATVRVGVATGVTVPRVTGLSAEEAQRTAALATASGLIVSVRSTDQAGAAGVVLRQEPAANARVARGTTLTLFIPRPGVVTVAVPDLVGRSRQDAQSALVGLRLVARTSESESDRPVGTVISQSPAAGTQVVPPSEVALVLARQVVQPVGPAPPPPVGSGAPSTAVPLEPLLPVWFGPLLVVLTLIGLSTLGLVRSGRGDTRARPSAQATTPKVDVEPGAGEQALRLEVSGRSLVDLEVRVRVTRDAGEQSVQVAGGDLVAEERRIYE